MGHAGSCRTLRLGFWERSHGSRARSSSALEAYVNSENSARLTWSRCRGWRFSIVRRARRKRLAQSAKDKILILCGNAGPVHFKAERR